MNTRPSHFSCEAADLGEVVLGALHFVGTDRYSCRLPAWGSFSYLLLEVSRSTARRALGPDGDLYDLGLHPGTLATSDFPGEFLCDKCSPVEQRSAGHVVPNVGA